MKYYNPQPKKQKNTFIFQTIFIAKQFQNSEYIWGLVHSILSNF